MTDRDDKCENRIDQELKRTVADIKIALQTGRLLDNLGQDNVDDAKECILQARWDRLFSKDEAREYWDILKANPDGETPDSWREGLLSIDKLPVQYRVQMSWGGPGDEFIVTIEGRDITEISYRFMDWFDGASRQLHGIDFETVKEMLEGLYFEEAE